MTAKALKETGIKLGGDVILTAVVGEIGLAPVDEYQGFRYFGKGIGTEYAIRYGPPIDFALVSETTDFGLTWAECGILYIRVIAKGRRIYSPRLREYEDIKQHPNSILKMCYLINFMEQWAHEYEARTILEFPGGIIKPKVNIGAIRGGYPPFPSMTADSCSVFVSIRLLPGEGPAKVVRELKKVVDESGIEAEISTYLFRRGYIAKHVDPLLDAIKSSYYELSNDELPPVSSEVTSMWRDLNVYNENGIPAVTFGPPRYIDETVTRDLGIKYLTKDDLVKTAKLYALIALKICSFFD
jgi:acetylornithine deacetylase/succinyl-diaminopimelate desuccinylase-like protein